jgi:hypothetical protein
MTIPLGRGKKSEIAFVWLIEMPSLQQNNIGSSMRVYQKTRLVSKQAGTLNVRMSPITDQILAANIWNRSPLI